MIIFSNIRKSFGKRTLLNEISFHVFPGERVGLVGPNGVGKSTIFKLINGEISEEKGQITIRKGARIGHLKQQFLESDFKSSIIQYTTKGVSHLDKISKQITKLEDQLHTINNDQEASDKILVRIGNLQTEYEHIGGYRLQNLAETALCGLGFQMKELSRPMQEFSGGWRMRAELARVLVSDPDLLLLDEPTNYLDLPAIEWLHDFLKSFGGTMILVSHDRFLLNSMVNITLELFQGKITKYPGNYDYYTKIRNERNHQLLAAKKNQDAKRDKMERVIERFRTKATKAAQAKSMMKKLDKLEEINAPEKQITGANIRLIDPPRCGQNIVELIDVSKSYDSKSWIYKDINLSVINGEKIGVVGTNGMGKTTLLRILAEELEIEKGKRRQGHNVEIGYHSQDYLETMNPQDNVFKIARSANTTISDSEVRSILGSFGFHGEDVQKTVEVLSGGEKVRLSLSKQLLNPPNFLLLDEPTTHLDIPSRIGLENALVQFKGTLCIVSHDIEFIRNVANIIYEVSPAGLKKYFGNYEYYREKKKNELGEEKRLNTQVKDDGKHQSTPKQKTNETAAEKKARKRREAEERQRQRGFVKPLKSKLEEIERKLAILERQEKELSANYQQDLSQEKIAEINKTVQENSYNQNILMKEWEKLSAELEKTSANLPQ